MHVALSTIPRNLRRSLADLGRDQRGAVYVEHLVMVSAGLLIAVMLETVAEILLTHFTTITTGLYLGVP